MTSPAPADSSIALWSCLRCSERLMSRAACRLSWLRSETSGTSEPAHGWPDRHFVAIRVTSNSIERRRVMPPPNPATTAQALGEYIFNASPYTRKEESDDSFPTAMNPDLTETEKSYQAVEW